MVSVVNKAFDLLSSKAAGPLLRWIRQKLESRGGLFGVVLLRSLALAPMLWASFAVVDIITYSFPNPPRLGSVAGSDAAPDGGGSDWRNVVGSTLVTLGYAATAWRFSPGQIVFCQDGWAQSDVFLAQRLEPDATDRRDPLLRAQIDFLVLTLRNRDNFFELESTAAKSAVLKYGKGGENAPALGAFKLAWYENDGSIQERLVSSFNKGSVELALKNTRSVMIGSGTEVPRYGSIDPGEDSELLMFKVSDDVAEGFTDSTGASIECKKLTYRDQSDSQGRDQEISTGVALLDRGQAADILFTLVAGLLMSVFIILLMELVLRVLRQPEEDDRDAVSEET